MYARSFRLACHCANDYHPLHLVLLYVWVGMSVLIAGCFADCEWQSTTSAFRHLSEMVAVGCLSKVVALWSLLNISARVAVTVEAAPHIAALVLFPLL